MLRQFAKNFPLEIIEAPIDLPEFALSLVWHAIGGESAENLINIVLDGLPAADGIAGPIMPGFAGVLTNQQFADLVRYLRRDVAPKSDWPNLDEFIRNARSTWRPKATAQNQSTR
jgi:hypothetical protein